jgi:hypothetical protein
MYESIMIVKEMDPEVLTNLQVFMSTINRRLEYHLCLYFSIIVGVASAWKVRPFSFKSSI